MPYLQCFDTVYDFYFWFYENWTSLVFCHLQCDLGKKINALFFCKGRYIICFKK